MFAKIMAGVRDRPSFRQEALNYFANRVGEGMLQRIDGVECFSPLSRYWFWKVRLNLMVARGDLSRRAVGSVWRSCNGMPAYGLPHLKGK